MNSQMASRYLTTNTKIITATTAKTAPIAIPATFKEPETEKELGQFLVQDRKCYTEQQCEH